jgi:hypothetical protein
MAVPDVSQCLDEIAEVVVAPEEARSSENLDVGLLDQLLSEVTGAAHRPRRPKQLVDVVSGNLRIKPALLPLDGDRGQNGTAPSPFQDASFRSS